MRLRDQNELCNTQLSLAILHIRNLKKRLGKSNYFRLNITLIFSCCVWPIRSLMYDYDVTQEINGKTCADKLFGKNLGLRNKASESRADV